MFEILETQKIVDGEAAITLVPARSGVISDLLAAPEHAAKSPPPVKH
jgi:hypothetical protein